MKVINPSFSIIPQGNSIQDIFKHIEMAGRTCYKSENNITEHSAKLFVNMLTKSGHLAPLEHGTVYLSIPHNEFVSASNENSAFNNTWTKYVIDLRSSSVYLTSNYRWIVENGYEHWLKYMCEPNHFHEKRITVKFICSRAISHELVRHRTFSFCQESQRYCNYSKDKFGREVTFIDPLYSDYDKKLITTEAFNNVYEILVSALEEAESYYFMLLDEGFKAEEAREVLPNATKTEIVMTGFESDWIRFFNLRCDKAAHPEMRRLAIPLKEKLNIV